MNYKTIIKYAAISLCIASVTGCVTAARKVGGQLRPTDVEFKHCPQLTYSQYALIVPDNMSMKDQDTKKPLAKKYRNLFYQSLEAAFKKDNLKVTKVTSIEQAKDLPVISVKFDALNHSFVLNRWELLGDIYVTIDGKESKYPFDAYTHKTIESTDSLVEKLAERLVGCVVNVQQVNTKEL
ncbi:MAG: hypothetical protein EP298_04190 [Gammaproteobacteria bacterium]|nr:MAG: hypothetical protein EP298_04190 [Gammaproteobacteria bacterium]UTW43830.1 hypothetical protein KFE69_07000 [bacterium SCSIO 12844]